MLFIYLLGMVFCWLAGVYLYGPASLDLEDPVSTKHYVLGVLLLSIFWPFWVMFILFIRLYWWVADKWEDWERQK